MHPEIRVKEYFFRSGLSYSDYSIWVSKICKNVKGDIFFTIPEIKWCQTGFFHSLALIKGFFNLGTTQLGCFFQSCWTHFHSIHAATPSLEDYEQMYIVGMQVHFIHSN